MDKRDASRRGLLSGLASAGSLWDRSEYPKLSGSDLSRIRADVVKVGGYFSSVIERENGKNTSAPAALPKAKRAA